VNSRHNCFHTTELLAEFKENSRQISLNITTIPRSVRVPYVFADVHSSHFGELKMRFCTSLQLSIGCMYYNISDV
jgi:hypothetical protein